MSITQPTPIITSPTFRSGGEFQILPTTHGMQNARQFRGSKHAPNIITPRPITSLTLNHEDLWIANSRPCQSTATQPAKSTAPNSNSPARERGESSSSGEAVCKCATFAEQSNDQLDAERAAYQSGILACSCFPWNELGTRPNPICAE